MKKKFGTILRSKTDKTCVVKVKCVTKHPKYHIYSYKLKNFLVHDPTNLGKEGMTVLIQENVPLSARKCWLLNRIITRPLSNI